MPEAKQQPPKKQPFGDQVRDLAVLVVTLQRQHGVHVQANICKETDGKISYAVVIHTGPLDQPPKE